MAGDANYDKVSLLLHGDGTNGATVFVDDSPRPKSATVYGGAQISTAQSKFGGASMLFDGSGDYLAFADHADFEFGAGDFTIGFWLRLNGWSNSNGGDYGVTLVAKDNSSGRGWGVAIAGTVNSFDSVSVYGFESGGARTTVSGSYSFMLNMWHYIEIDRSGNMAFVSVDGVVLNPGGTAFATTIRDTTSVVTVGALMYDSGTYTYYVHGHIEDLFIVKGVAEHTSDFTPSSSARKHWRGEVAGVVRDDAGTPCAREVRIYDRTTGALGGVVTSDATTGAYLLTTNTIGEVQRIVLDDAGGTLYNDIIDRVIPA